MSNESQSTRASAIDRAAEAEGGGLEARLAVLLGKRLYQAAGFLFVLAILLIHFDPIAQMLLIAFTGAIIGVAFNGLIIRLPFSRTIGTAIIGVMTLATLGLITWFTITTIARELEAFVEDLPEITALFAQWELWIAENLGVEVELIDPEEFSQLFTAAMGFEILGGALGVLEVIAIGILVLMGAFFVVAEPNKQLLTPLLRSVPPGRREAYRRMFHLLGIRLTGWLVGTVVSMLVVGVFSTIAFIIIGLPYSILLGVINGILGVIPLIGAWIGGIVAVLVALFYDPSLVIWVILIIVAIQELEGNVVRPMVMAGTARVHPFVTLLSLLLFTSIFGLLGAILSIPLVLLFTTIIEVLWIEETLHAQNDEIAPVVKP